MTERARKAWWVFLGCSVILLLLDFTDTGSHLFLIHLAANLLMLGGGLYFLFVKPRRGPQQQDQ
jgi:hypothetical protein